MMDGNGRLAQGEDDTMLWKEGERSKIRAVQMDNLKGLLGIRRVDRVSNAWIRELRGVTKGGNKRIDECSPVVGPCGKDGGARIAKRAYVGEYVLVVALWVG